MWFYVILCVSLNYGDGTTAISMPVSHAASSPMRAHRASLWRRRSLGDITGKCSAPCVHLLHFTKFALLVNTHRFSLGSIRGQFRTSYLLPLVADLVFFIFVQTGTIPSSLTYVSRRLAIAWLAKRASVRLIMLNQSTKHFGLSIYPIDEPGYNCGVLRGGDDLKSHPSFIFTRCHLVTVA